MKNRHSKVMESDSLFSALPFCPLPGRSRRRSLVLPLCLYAFFWLLFPGLVVLIFIFFETRTLVQTLILHLKGGSLHHEKRK